MSSGGWVAAVPLEWTRLRRGEYCADGWWHRYVVRRVDGGTGWELLVYRLEYDGSGRAARGEYVERGGDPEKWICTGAAELYEGLKRQRAAAPPKAPASVHRSSPPAAGGPAHPPCQG